MNSKKTMLTLGILLALSSGFAVQGADLTIKTDTDVKNLESDTTWAKHDGDKHWIYSQVAASGNNIGIGEKDSTSNPTINYSVYGGVSMDAQSKIATDAAKNTVTFNGGTFAKTEKILVGGQVNEGNFNAVSNTVNIHGGTLEGSVYGGIVGARASGSAQDNTVSVDGGTINGMVVGGNVQNTVGIAVRNTVNISGQATIKGQDIYGAFVAEAASSAENNSISISGGTFGKQSIVGGSEYFSQKDSTGSITKNSVTITGGTFEGANIYGGRIVKGGKENITNSGAVSGNAVTISGVNNKENEKFGNIYGGRNFAGEASENTVTISDSKLTVDNIYGGFSKTGAVKDNVVEINGNVIATGKVSAGYTDGNGSVTGNKLIINSGTFNGTNLLSGYGKGEVSGNILSLNGGKITGTVAAAKGNTLSNNRLEVVGNVELTEATLSYGNGHTLAIYENDKREKNTLEVKGLSAGKGGIISFEGLKFNDETFTLQVVDAGKGGNANNNVSWAQNTGSIQLNSFDVMDTDLAVGTKISKTVAINGVRFGIKDSDPGLDKVKIDNLNKDHIHVSDNGVYGYQFNAALDKTQSFVSDGTKNDADKNNSKIVIDADVTKAVLAGKYTSADGTYANTTATGTIGDGNLKLGTDGITSTNASIVAGAYSESGDAAGGNVTISGELKAANFFKTTDTKADKTIYAGYSTQGQSTGNTLTLHDATTDIALKAGKDKVSNNAVSITGTNSVQDITGFNTYTFNNVNVASKDTMLTIKGNTDISKDTTYHVNLATNQTAKAGDTLHLISGDTVDLTGYSAALNSTQGVGLDVSGMVVGDKTALTYKVTDVKASAKANDVAASHVTAVGFLTEGTDLVLYGINSVAQEDTYGLQTFAATERSDSSYTNGTDIDGWKVLAGVGGRHKLTSGDLAWGVFAERGLGSYTTNLEHGSGDVEYNGGGAALRYTKDSGLYTEASFRLGTLHDDVDNILGGYDYDTSANYQAFHVGVGKLIPSGNGTWDIYGKYFYTKADDAGFTVDNQYYGLDTVESQRIRLGARYSKPTNERLAWYYGAAWEYEFDGDADGSVAGYALNTASLGGSTVLGEVGLTYKPQADSRWDLELGIKGYTGERDGVSGVLRGAYHF